jgi:hypothetical protein
VPYPYRGAALRHRLYFMVGSPKTWRMTFSVDAGARLCESPELFEGGVMRRLQTWFLLIPLIAATALGQPALSNADVIKLDKAGLSDDFIINLIDQQGSHLWGDVASLIEMKAAGVDARVIAAVSKKSPPQEPLHSSAVLRLVKAGFSEPFILDLMSRNLGKYSLSAARIVELRQAGVSERVLSVMLSQNADAVLPAGSEITVRMIDSIDSDKADPGREFRASLKEPIEIGNDEVVPSGADTFVRLTGEREAGKLTGRAELTVELASIRINGILVPVTTSSVTEYSNSQTARTAKTAAAVGALGAIIGAIAGGGKGAAIGAGAGAATGAGAQVFMKGQRVFIPSETVLTFTTQDPLKLP